jgi:hypothetical protein
MKTNAVRLLEERGIAHELREYKVDPDDLRAESRISKIIYARSAASWRLKSRLPESVHVLSLDSPRCRRR